ncbi:MAG TPA: hypothetical protein VFC41_01475 [Anaerovoracaceae bacterium]|nr:hypothetical protein [Anaerovoracaceae bacterium]
MKAEIEEGMLMIIAENKTETYAISQWFNNHADGCSYYLKALDQRIDIGYKSEYEKKKITLFHRIWLKIQLFFYR